MFPDDIQDKESFIYARIPHAAVLNDGDMRRLRAELQEMQCLHNVVNPQPWIYKAGNFFITRESTHEAI